MGGHLRQENDGLRVFGNEQHRAERTLPLLYQSAGAGAVLQRDHGLPHGGGRGRGQAAEKRDTAQHPAHAAAGGVHREADAVRAVGRRHDTRTRQAVGNRRKGQDADRNGLRTEDGARHAAYRPRPVRRPLRQQGEPLRENDCGVLSQIRRAERHAVRLFGFGDVPAGAVERVQRDQTQAGGGLRHTLVGDTLHSGMQERKGSQGRHRRDERGKGAGDFRLDLHARNGRKRAETGGGGASSRHPVATLRSRAARRACRAKRQRGSQVLRGRQGGRDYLRGGEVARQLQVQPASLQADLHLAAQKRCDGCAYHRRGRDGREIGHELLRIHGYSFREHGFARQSPSGKESRGVGERAQDVLQSQECLLVEIGGLHQEARV